MKVTCRACAAIYDDADCTTLCPHPLIMPRNDLERKKLALTLVGRSVCFNYLPEGPAYRVQSVNFIGMVTIDGLPGEFAPHLFVLAPTEARL